jgi:hypothetical protein
MDLLKFCHEAIEPGGSMIGKAAARLMHKSMTPAIETTQEKTSQNLGLGHHGQETAAVKACCAKSACRAAVQQPTLPPPPSSPPLIPPDRSCRCRSHPDAAGTEIAKMHVSRVTDKAR